MDVKCLTADKYLDAILASYAKLPDRLVDNEDAKQAIDILKRWDEMATVDNGHCQFRLLLLRLRAKRREASPIPGKLPPYSKRPSH